VRLSLRHFPAAFPAVLMPGSSDKVCPSRHVFSYVHVSCGIQTDVSLPGVLLLLW
jgi:hypothetical protein